jgi:hypothetical protein
VEGFGGIVGATGFGGADGVVVEFAEGVAVIEPGATDLRKAPKGFVVGVAGVGSSFFAGVAGMGDFRRTFPNGFVGGLAGCVVDVEFGGFIGAKAPTGTDLRRLAPIALDTGCVGCGLEVAGFSSLLAPILGSDIPPDGEGAMELATIGAFGLAELIGVTLSAVLCSLGDGDNSASAKESSFFSSFFSSVLSSFFTSTTCGASSFYFIRIVDFVIYLFFLFKLYWLSWLCFS